MSISQLLVPNNFNLQCKSIIPSGPVIFPSDITCKTLTTTLGPNSLGTSNVLTGTHFTNPNTYAAIQFFEQGIELESGLGNGVVLSVAPGGTTNPTYLLPLDQPTNSDVVVDVAPQTLSNKIFNKTNHWSSLPFFLTNTSISAITSTTTVLIANLLGGIIQVGGTNAAQTLNWDSAANIVAALTNPVIGSTFQVKVINNATQIWTLGTGTNITTSYSDSNLLTFIARDLYFQVTNVLTPAVTIWG